MKKKPLSLLLVGAMTLSMAACGGSDTSETGSTAGAATGTSSAESAENVDDGEIYEVVIQYPTLGTTPEDLQLVEDALNEITEPEIGVHVTFYPCSAFELSNTTNLMVSSGEKLDLAMCMFEGGAQSYVNKGMLLELDDLVNEYGADILEAEGVAMAGGYYNGSLYAIPTEEKMGRVKAFECRKDLVDKYNIEYDANKIYTMEELTEIFAIVKAGEGERFYCVAANANEYAPYTYFDTSDYLGASYASGVLTNYGKDSDTVVNYFETEEFANSCNVVRSWFEEGYLSQDCNTTTDSALTQMQTGNYFGMFSNAEPDMIAAHSASMQAYIGTDVVPFYTTASASRSQDYQVTQWMIPITCDNPEKTMQFLNLMYGSKEVVNLLYKGIEGVHYNFVEGSDCVVEFPEGIDQANTPYAAILNVWGDKMKDYVTPPLDETYYATMKAFNDGITEEHTSDSLGYCFNSDPVKTQYAAVSDVITQYDSALGYGVIDPADQIVEFRAALKAAGIDEIIAENQRQFDEWKSAQ